MSSQAAVLHHTRSLSGVPSDLVIPAVRGEYYVYSSEFTTERPLYALMKCKSNKSRPAESAERLGREVNLLFRFDGSDQVQVCTIKEAHSLGLLGGNINVESFGDTWIAPTDITVERFHDLRSRKDIPALTKMCRIACSERNAPIMLEPDMVVAMMTDGGKYGLFRVKDLGPASIQIEACHILL